MVCGREYKQPKVRGVATHVIDVSSVRRCSGIRCNVLPIVLRLEYRRFAARLASTDPQQADCSLPGIDLPERRREY